MNENTTIKVNNSKQTDLEFDVAIQGLTDQTHPEADVRFVINNVNEQYSLSVKCQRSQNDKWLARLPALNLESKQQPFHIEVIVDGYYFAPATGTLMLVSEPKVAIKENTSKNMSVSASFAKARVIESDVQKIDLGTVQFGVDPNFGHASRSFTKILRASADLLDSSIGRDGSVKNDVRKRTIQGTMETLQNVVKNFSSLLRNKKS